MADVRYFTTRVGCSCPARRFNPAVPCKHMKRLGAALDLVQEQMKFNEEVRP